MNLLLWRLLAWGLLLPLFALLFMPLTERGSRLLLESAERILPVELEYGGGHLAGELQLTRVAWGNARVTVEVQDILLELSPTCLWYSKLCFQQLYARQLDVTVLPRPKDAPAPPESAQDDLLFEFPLPLEAKNLRVDALRVMWENGEWRQDSIEGATQISDSTIRVTRALVQGASLSLRGAVDPLEQFQLPRIRLPFELLVDELVLEAGAWDVYGTVGALDQLRLSGNWRRTELRLDMLDIRAAALGRWSLRGDIDFSSNWPLALTAEGVLPEVAGWPDLLERKLSLTADGDLHSLDWQGQLGGSVSVLASGSLGILAPQPSFRLVASADWAQTLALADLVALPEPLAGTRFSTPLELEASGTLEQQQFQLAATVSGLGYESLDLRLAGSHSHGRIELEDLRLEDSAGANKLLGSGVLDYTEGLSGSALLETSGLDLLPLSDYGGGRIEGKLQLEGELAGQEWVVSLLGADLRGTLNKLPVRLEGYAGIDSQLRLQPTELRAEFNGTRMQLRSATDEALPARLDIEMDDLGLWQPGSHGALSLQASLMPGWDYFSVDGTLQQLQWQGLEIGSGSIKGNYQLALADKFSLEVSIADLAVAGLEFDSALLAASGDTTRLTTSLRSRGDVEGLLEVSARSGAGGAWTGELAATTLQTPQGAWYLGEPVKLEFAPSPARLRLAPHCWSSGESRLCPGDTLLAEQGRASLALEGDLSPFAAFLPPYLEVKGALTGQFSAAWAPGQTALLEGDLQASDLRLTRHFGAGESGSVSWQKIAASVRKDAAGLVFDAGIYAGDSKVVGLDVHLGASPGEPVAATLAAADFQLASLAPLASGMSVLEGHLNGSLRLAGTTEQPRAEGSITLSDGRFVLVDNPTVLEQFELQFGARGEEVVVQGRGVLGGGPLAVSGTLVRQPWRLALAIEGDHHEILLPPYTQMLVSPRLDMTLTKDLLDLKGNIAVHEGSLLHQELPQEGVKLSADVVEVDLAGTAADSRLPLDTRMNIGLLIEDKFRIVGDMVNATVGGELLLSQAPRKPLQVFGNLNVIGGELRAYQQRLRIQRGTISFAGTPDNPDLDLRAQREIPGDRVVVGLQLQGSLKQAKLEVFSDPAMSHGEAMSYLVRGRGLDSGADADGVAMALSLGAGLVNRSAVITELNRIPGISNLAFGSEGSNESDTAATVGGYIGERLYLSYGLGIYEPITVLTARLYLQTRLWLEVVSRLENSMDLYYSFDVD